jgi:hypothetical protein
MWGVERLTGVSVYDKSPNVVSALDPELSKYPYLYIVEPSRMVLTWRKPRRFGVRGPRQLSPCDDFWEQRRGFVEENWTRSFPIARPSNSI